MSQFLKDELIPYFLLKYPQSETAETNLRLSKQVAGIDNFSSNYHELVYLSKTKF